MISWIFLGVSVAGLVLTVNAFRPVRGWWLALPSFVAGWLVSELPVHRAVLQVALTVAFVAAGALDAWPGWAALVLNIMMWSAACVLLVQADRARAVIDDALAEVFAGEARRGEGDDALPWRRLVLPFGRRDPRVEKVRNVVFAQPAGRPLRLDIYRPRDPTRRGRCPVLLYVHGGAWVMGDKREQGVPMMLHLAARGWICVTANYRLGPRAMFPDQLDDVVAALRWIQATIAEFGGDRDYVAISGGSAGGHLASLAALTTVDVPVRACVPFYGVYDFTNRNGIYHSGMARFLSRYVMKATLEGARDEYERASPMSQVHRGSPPFFVIHGTNDTLVPIEEARRFVAALRAVSDAPVAYAELPGAQHAFEVFPSLRTVHVLRGVARFLELVRAARDKA